MKNHTLSMLQEDLSQFSKEELSKSASWLGIEPFSPLELAACHFV